MTTASITFAEHIRPLFRESDRASMNPWFDLWAWTDVRDNAAEILERLEDGSMPCDRPWPESSVGLFRDWLKAGCPA